MEHMVSDPQTGRVITADLDQYLVPVNADVPFIDIIILPEHDPYVNPIGVKGIGEIGIVGAPAAIANAVFHATGKRIRELLSQRISCSESRKAATMVGRNAKFPAGSRAPTGGKRA